MMKTYPNLGINRREAWIRKKRLVTIAAPTSANITTVVNDEPKNAFVSNMAKPHK